MHKPVHPRACGEQERAEALGIQISGSSPRVRGTDHRIKPTIYIKRFIPARAGNRSRESSDMANQSVHPRACGEQMSALICLATAIGSSPRVRGTAFATLPCLLRLRFIPARAGNSCAAYGLDIADAVHPRACGEQFRQVCSVVISSGSSPRVRGTVESCHLVHLARRFIPARAGNSYATALCGFPIAVHPRACGEQGLARISSP